MSSKTQMAQRNLAFAISGMVLGLGLATLAGLTIKNALQEKASVQTAWESEHAACRSLAERQGFANHQRQGETIFSATQMTPDEAYAGIMKMQEVIWNCPSMQIKAACMGWSCQPPPGVIANGMPFYFRMSEKGAGE